MEGSNESSDRRTLLLVIAGAVVLVAAGIAFLRPSAETTIGGPAPDLQSTDSDHPAVSQLIESGGFSLFGITFSSPTLSVTTGFMAPAECRAVLDAGATTWPTGDARCGPDGTVTGEISGGGIAVDGRAIVFVEFEVDRECFDQVQTGTTWPPPGSACDGRG